MHDKSGAFVVRFVPEELDEKGREEFLPRHDFGDQGINWWLHWLDATVGWCTIELGKRSIRIHLFADFSGSLRDFPRWAERVRRKQSSILEFIEQGVDVQLVFEGEDGAPTLKMLDHGRRLQEVDIDGVTVLETWRQFFEQALAFYAAHGVDCTDGRSWVERVFPRT